MRILICDDEIKNITGLKGYVEEYMNNHGITFEIETTTNPTDVVKTDAIYDLVFLDIQMPELDGFSLARKLKARNSKVVILQQISKFIRLCASLQSKMSPPKTSPKTASKKYSPFRKKRTLPVISSDG